MSNFDDKLKETLSSGVEFNEERASQTRFQALNTYTRRIRMVERLTWIYIIVTIVIGYIAFLGYLEAQDLKHVVGWAALGLLAIQGNVLIKLWYWIMNCKYAILKEVKLMAMGAENASLADEKGLIGSGVWSKNLTKRERWLWYAGLIAIIVFIASVWNVTTTDPRRVTVFDGYTTLDENGNAEIIYTITDVYNGMMPAKSFEYECQVGTEARWIDEHGRELPAESTTDGDRKIYTVSYIDPLMQGDYYTQKIVQTCPAASKQEDGKWTYNCDWQFGLAGTIQYSMRIQLPSGAHVLSLTPESASQSEWNGHNTVRIEQRTGRREKFKYQVVYEFAE